MLVFSFLPGKTGAHEEFPVEGIGDALIERLLAEGRVRGHQDESLLT
jgi:hypothetical protein